MSILFFCLNAHLAFSYTKIRTTTLSLYGSLSVFSELKRVLIRVLIIAEFFIFIRSQVASEQFSFRYYRPKVVLTNLR